MRVVTRAVVVAALAGLVTGVTVAPASAKTCNSAILGLDSVIKPLKAEAGPQALRSVGQFNAETAHELGGLRFGPVAKAINESCR